MTNEELKKAYADKKVLFASNGEDRAGSILQKSKQTYSAIAEDFYLNDFQKTRQYGYAAFLDIFKYAVEHDFNYIIYIDADCFIVNHENLLTEFEDFQESGMTFAGPSDGGIFCHRNCNRMSINPFLMFVNVQKLKDSYSNGSFDFGRLSDYSLAKVKPEEVAQWQQTFDAFNRYRTQTKLAVPHASVISASWSNDRNVRKKFGINQHPWTYNDADVNHEPYYNIFLGYLGKHGTGIRFLYAGDYPCPQDPSGITSAVYRSNPKGDTDRFGKENIICLHTWFTRCYSTLSTDSFWRQNTGRINAVADFTLGAVRNPGEARV